MVIYIKEIFDSIYFIFINKMKDLVIIILTFNLDEKVLPARYLPKVCHKLEDKTIIELCIENCLKLKGLDMV